MAWQNLTDAEVLEEFTPAERAALKNIQGTELLGNIVGRAINEARGAIQGGGYPLGADGTIPDSLRSDVIALARWRWLVAFPELKRIQTKERHDAYADAQAKLEKVSQQKFSIEPPTAGTNSPAGSWNSENKLIMRTHPVPDAATQFQSTSGTDAPYANPNQNDT